MAFDYIRVLGSIDDATKFLKKLLPSNHFLCDDANGFMQKSDELLKNGGNNGLFAIPANVSLIASKVESLATDLPIVVSDLKNAVDSLQHMGKKGKLDEHMKDASVTVSTCASMLEHVVRELDEADIDSLQRTFVKAMRLYGRLMSFYNRLKSTFVTDPAVVIRENLILYNAIQQDKEVIANYIDKCSKNFWLLHKLAHSNLNRDKKEEIQDLVKDLVNNNNILHMAKPTVYNCNARNWQLVLDMLKNNEAMRDFLASKSEKDVVADIKKIGRMPLLIDRLNSLLKEEEVKQEIENLQYKLDKRLNDVVKTQMKRKNAVDNNINTIKDSFSLPKQYYNGRAKINVILTIAIGLARYFVGYFNLSFGLFKRIALAIIVFIAKKLFTLLKLLMFAFYVIVVSMIFIATLLSGTILRFVSVILMAFGVTYNVPSVGHVANAFVQWLNFGQYSKLCYYIS